MTISTRLDNARVIRAARGSELSAKSWLTEAPLRMLMNNLDPEVAERAYRALIAAFEDYERAEWARKNAVK